MVTFLTFIASWKRFDLIKRLFVTCKNETELASWLVEITFGNLSANHFTISTIICGCNISRIIQIQVLYNDLYQISLRIISILYDIIYWFYKNLKIDSLKNVLICIFRKLAAALTTIVIVLKFSPSHAFAVYQDRGIRKCIKVNATKM